MSARSWGLAAVLALATLAPATTAAEPLDILRDTPSRISRGQLEQYALTLALRAAASELSLGELVVDELASSPEGALLLGYLYSNAPKAVVLDLVTTLGGGTSERTIGGDLTATLALRVTGDFCDLANAGLTVRAAGAGGGDRFSGEARLHGGFCFWRGLFVGPDVIAEEDDDGSISDTWPNASMSLFPLRMSGALALNTQTRFSSLRNQPTRRYSEARYGLAVEGLRFMPSDPRRGVSFIYLTAEQRWEWPGVFDGKRGFELTAGFGFFRLFRMRDPHALADRAIDIIDIQLHGTRFDEAVAIIDLYPVRLRGVGLGSSAVLFDGSFGFTGSGGTISSSDCIDGGGCVEETITTGPNVAEVNTWAAEASLSIGRRPRAGGVSFVRRLDSNILGQLALEARVTAWSQWVRGPLFLRASAFGGTATHYLDVDARGDERFAGGTLDLTYAVARDVQVGAQLDGIVAYDRDPVLDDRVAGSGLRAFATLTWTRQLERVAARLPAPPQRPAPAPPERVDPDLAPPGMIEPPTEPPTEEPPTEEPAAPAAAPVDPASDP